MLATNMVISYRLKYITMYPIVGLVLVYYVFPYLRSHAPTYVRDRYPDLLSGTFKQDDKQLFVADFMEKEVGGDLDGSALAELCASKTWFPESEGIILTCEHVPGGIGEVKNGILNCIRLAVELGGAYRHSTMHVFSIPSDQALTFHPLAQLVLPRISPRSTSDIANLHGGHDSKGLSLEHFFSLPHLTTSLQNHCPQLTVHASLDALWDRPSLLKPLTFALNELTSAFLQDTATILAEPALLRPQFLALLSSLLPAAKKIYYPVRVHLTNSVAAPMWPTLDEPGVRKDLGKLLRTREDVQVLAASALWNLAARYSSELHRDGGFVGVHLRTEKDARDGGFPGWDDQVRYFFEYLRNHAPSAADDSDGEASDTKGIIFLATGLTEKDDDVQRFRRQAAADLPGGASVLLKRDLLDASEVAALDGLSWDQRALVDYEILLRAGMVLGIVESRFDWAVALRRAEAYGGLDGDDDEEEEEAFTAAGVLADSELVMWADRWSRLFGRAETAVEMYLGAWP